MGEGWTISDTPRVAWTARGRRHALDGEPRQPPDDSQAKRWYLDGYLVGKRQREREAAAQEEADTQT